MQAGRKSQKCFVFLYRLCICIYVSARVYIRVPVVSSQYFPKQHGMLPVFLRVPVVFSKDVFKQHGMLPVFLRVRIPSTNLEYNSRVGLLILWFFIVCVYVYTFLHAFISECLWCRPNTFQNSTECCLFFSECLWSFPRTFSNSTECCPFFSEYESIPSTTPECESRVLIPSTTPE